MTRDYQHTQILRVFRDQSVDFFFDRLRSALRDDYLSIVKRLWLHRRTEPGSGGPRKQALACAKEYRKAIEAIRQDYAVEVNSHGQ